ncbi:MBG domain-containing protein [Fimbriiglobus ruber]|uniref:Flagellar hook-length control protein FliK n=1 Tax=Fimbriiglobus ruber TaxID=1908690 RepID=A0A225E3Z1_9BACT|nr:MBG domain-containing protein [Fimbriiglobus ruber]OWK43117.1 Flagellar hook-length control protein FliK [Fimbriiglobus ruber]
MSLSTRARISPRTCRLDLVVLEDRLTPNSTVLAPLVRTALPAGSSAPEGLTPDQIRHAYGIDAIPSFNGATADGAGQTIAIVVAFQDPTIASDLAGFDSAFGTAANEINATPVSSFFSIVNQSGGASLPPAPPASDNGWIGETALDVEWAHAIAPKADIILVECATDNDPDLYAGTKWAVNHPGVSVVSGSWGGAEYSGETGDDSNFITPATHAGVTVVVSAGDDGTVEYPAASPDVVAVGATTLTLNPDNSWASEVGWSYNKSTMSGGGGGLSTQEAIPAFQDSVADVVGVVRGVPDVSYNGGSDSAVSVYDTTTNSAAKPWSAEFGSSAGTPQWAALIAIVDQGRAAAGLNPLDGSRTLPDLYSLPTTDFHDITSGHNAAGDPATVGYDLLTGLGTPIANKLVPDLVAGPGTTSVSTTTLTATPSSSTAFGSITLTAAVTGVGLTPTGSVEFLVGSTNLGTVSLVGGTATLVTSNLPAGTETVTAQYLGDANNQESSAPATVSVSSASSVTTLMVGMPTLVYGGSDTFTATVTGIAGHTPTGSVDFKSGTTDLGTVPLTGTTATLSTTALPAGTDSVTANYLGDTNYDVSNGTAFATVQKATATVAALDQSKSYGAAIPPLTISATGLVNGDTTATAFTGSPATTATAASPLGAYPITQGTLASADYNFTFTPGTLTVVKAALTVTADNVQILVGAAIPTLTYTVTGLANGDTAAVVSGVTVSTTATAASPVGTYPITPVGGEATNYTVTDVPGTLSITLTPPVSPPPASPPPPSPPTAAAAESALLLGIPQIAVGADAGGSPTVQLRAADGTTQWTAMPFPGTFTGGVRTAAADFTAGGPPDVIAGSGPGISNEVVVLDGATGQPVVSFSPFESTFTGGVFVAVGDVTGDGIPDVIVTPDQSGGPIVAVYDGAALAQGQVVQVARFFGINDPSFRGGDRAAVGDLTGNGVGDLIVSAGFGGGPRVAIYDGKSIASGNPTELMPDFFAFESSLRNGVYVTAGDVTGGGYADLIFGAGPGGAPRVRIVDTKALIAAAGNFTSLDDPAVSGAGIASFFAGDVDSRGGVRVAVKNLDGDDLADVVTGDGEGVGATVTAYTGAAIVANGTTPLPGLTFDAFPGFTGGVYVG